MKHSKIETAAAGEVPPPVDLAGGSGQRQFTVFTVDGETFAVGLDEVKEIIRMPQVVRVPLTPPSLEGLTNLRGTVLPVVSTRALFGCEAAEPDDATRVVVLDHGQPVGIVVDRVVSVVSVDAGRIEDAAGVETSVRSDLLRGVIKDQGALGLVMVLDTARLIGQEFDALTIGSMAGAGLLASGNEPSATTTQGSQTAADEEIQLVSFEVAGQEYALPIQSVREIVQLPEAVTRVPKAASSVVGVIALRDRLLPVVSLRRLFGLAAKDSAETDRVAVVSLGEGASDTGSALVVGLLLDKVNEVLRVRRSGVDAMPPMLAADRDLAEITAICRLDGGKRLVSILSAEAMFEAPAVAEAIKGVEDNQEAAMNHTASRTATRAEDMEQFVVFRLEDEEFGVDIATVQEIVRVPDDLAKVPRTEDYIRGVMNLRGAVIPLVDQRARFNLPPCEDHDRQRIVVFTISGTQTGFIVDSVAEVMRIARADIKPAPEMTDPARRMIRRVANLPDTRRMILLLDTEKLIDLEPVATAA